LRILEYLYGKRFGSKIGEQGESLKYKMGSAGHVARITESSVHTGVLVVKLMETSQLGRHSLRLEGNITTDFEKVGSVHGLD